MNVVEEPRTCTWNLQPSEFWDESHISKLWNDLSISEPINDELLSPKGSQNHVNLATIWDKPQPCDIWDVPQDVPKVWSRSTPSPRLDNVCCVLDMDGYKIDKHFFVPREVSMVATSGKYKHMLIDLRVFSKEELIVPSNQYWKKRHFGLTYHPRPGERSIPYKFYKHEIKDFYNSVSSGKEYIMAYKGGHIEKNLLKELDIPALDLENFDCPKFVHLPLEKDCGEHRAVAYDLHCSLAETKAFMKWVLKNR